MYVDDWFLFYTHQLNSSCLIIPCTKCIDNHSFQTNAQKVNSIGSINYITERGVKLSCGFLETLHLKFIYICIYPYVYIYIYPKSCKSWKIIKRSIPNLWKIPKNHDKGILLNWITFSVIKSGNLGCLIINNLIKLVHIQTGEQMYTAISSTLFYYETMEVVTKHG